MPGQDGLEATRRIQQSKPRPVVLLTAHENPELLARAGDAGVGGYIVKPTSLQELDRTIAIAVARFADLVELCRLNEELRTALVSVKRLSGLLPILQKDSGRQGVLAIRRSLSHRTHRCAVFPRMLPGMHKEALPRLHPADLTVRSPVNYNPPRGVYYPGRGI